jgi:hypothetical protein
LIRRRTTLNFAGCSSLCLQLGNFELPLFTVAIEILPWVEKNWAKLPKTYVNKRKGLN